MTTCHLFVFMESETLAGAWYFSLTFFKRDMSGGSSENSSI